MKLVGLEMQNFRGIEKLLLQFDGKSTIIFGINGVGKSTVLRAIDLIYANILTQLLGTKRLANLDYDDIRSGKARANIHADFEFEDGKQTGYGREISRSRGRKHILKDLKSLVGLFEERYITKPYEDADGNWIEEPDKKNMPLFVNYGVNRSVIDVPVRVSKKIQFTKLSAFDKAIESKIDFRTLFAWFRLQEDFENQEKVRTSPDYEDRSLTAVKQAMLAMLEGFEDIHIERKPLAMKVKKDGKYFKIEQLSDGEKCTIALFGDLARRLSLANPSLINPLEGRGVVLIDELDLHMHTSWQRKILAVLKQTFPNIQFIITTHSPQILGELNEEYNLIYLKRVEDEVKIEQYKSLIGWDTNVILEELMQTSSVNEGVKTHLEKMYQHIAENQFKEAEEIADYLDELTNHRIDGVAKARVLIARGRRNEKSNKG